MSRRARRRQGAGTGSWLGRAALILALAMVLGTAVGYGLLRNYLHSDAFRLFLSAQVSKAAGVQGEFAPFRWDGLAVDTSGFDAVGDGEITRLQAEGLHTEVDLSGVRRGVWQLQGARIDRVEIAYEGRQSSETAAAPPLDQQREVEKAERKRWLPDRVEVTDLTIRTLNVRAELKAGAAAAEGMQVRLTSEPGTGGYLAEIDGGEVRLPWQELPLLDLQRVRLRYQDGSVFVTELAAAIWERGTIDAVGEWDARDETFASEGRAAGFELDEILSEDWSRRLTGEASSTFSLTNRSGTPAAHGSLSVENGVLTALPVLDSLAAYADTTRFRVLPLHEARADWAWREGEVTLSDLVIASDGLVRLEGRLVIRDGNLDGTFRLGLAPGTLASIPGAETEVFLPGERGLLWTSLRITGNLDDPKEDLTDRLIDAAGFRMFEMIPETGEKVLKFTRSLVGDDPSESVQKGVRAVEKGVEAIDRASGVIREVGGVLDGFLGSGWREKID